MSTATTLPAPRSFDLPTPDEFHVHLVRMAAESGADPVLARERMAQSAQLYAALYAEVQR